MHPHPIMLVSLSGCIPKRKVVLRTHKRRVSFGSQVVRMKRWFKIHPSVGRFESLFKAKDAKAVCRKLNIQLDLKRVPLAAFYMERE